MPGQSLQVTHMKHLLSLKQLLGSLEISFWKVVIPLMSEGHALGVATSQRIRSFHQARPWTVFLAKIAATVIAGVLLGLGLGLLITRIR